MPAIKFGTDGWRAVIADEFTFSNVRAVTRAIARYLEEQKRDRDGVVIGFDNRFLSEEFAAQASAVLLENSIKVYLCRRPSPTPAVAFAVKHYQSAGAIMFTASHNPSRYQGIKFIPHYAGPALPPETDRISELVQISLQEDDPGKDLTGKNSEYPHILQKLLEEASSSEKNAFPEPDKDTGEHGPEEELLKMIDPEGPYLKHLEQVIDINAIAAALPFVVIDSMHGASIGYLEAFLSPLGCRLEVIRGYRDPLFGGGLPDPSGHNLQKLRSIVLDLEAEAGLALDGDGDRLGVIAPDGKFLSANDILLLLLEHLVQSRQWHGVVARTVATTHNLDRLARHYGLRLVETPVGFKYIGQAIREQDAFLGGEESGGVSIRGHIPEKDGIMAALLFVEMLAAARAEPAELFQAIGAKIDLFSFNRWDIHTSSSQKEEILQKLRNWQPQEIAGLKVKEVNRTDGVKVLLEGGSWFLVRSSGTEDLFRLYIEAPDETMLEELRYGVRWDLGL
ncbi:MAG: phosphoglucomutase/phosphomannomutase family protein [Dethiobacter sp.]|nr:MAG: phosphoglucomutase/phosphomannomutase family protein [Dethiobacter sp.]